MTDPDLLESQLARLRRAVGARLDATDLPRKAPSSRAPDSYPMHAATETGSRPGGRDNMSQPRPLPREHQHPLDHPQVNVSRRAVLPRVAAGSDASGADGLTGSTPRARTPSNVRWVRIVLLVLTTLSLALVPSAAAAPLAARVVGVVDGDTIDVLTPDRHQLRIRLAEIDAPEHDQPWGQRSKQALSHLVFRMPVLVRGDTRDRYGRTIAHVAVNGLDVSREMVRTGAAWSYREYLTDRSLIGLEAAAQRQRVGLWSLPASETEPPWAWRHGGSRTLVESLPVTPPAGLSRTNALALGQCGAKRYCREMATCAEAVFYMKQCGLRRLDGDGDGVPCERLCRSSR
jgi:endonuclease YncB( thermonuclease family)